MRIKDMFILYIVLRLPKPFFTVWFKTNNKATKDEIWVA